MRTVKFVRSLNVEDVEVHTDQNSFQYRPHMKMVCLSDGAAGFIDDVIDVHVAPIHRIITCKDQPEPPYGIDREEILIAYSEEVQKLIQIPFDAIMRQNKDLDEMLFKTVEKKASAEYKLKVVETLSFLSRLKFLCTGSMAKEFEGRGLATIHPSKQGIPIKVVALTVLATAGIIFVAGGLAIQYGLIPHLVMACN